MATPYIKTNRIFTPIRKYAWLFVPLTAFGGLWYPKLGLLIIPLMLTLMVMGFFKGKYWCGNYCPHGSLFDYIIMPVSRFAKIPLFMKHKLMAALVLTWFMYTLTSRLIKAFAQFGSATFLDQLGYVFVFNYFIVTVVGTILALTVSPRAWCSFCPMSTFESFTYKLGKLLRANRRTDQKVTVLDANMCRSCGKCSRVCPMQLAPYMEFSEHNQYHNEACIRCSTCVANCPAEILTLANEEKALQIKEENIANDSGQKKVVNEEVTKLESASGL